MQRLPPCLWLEGEGLWLCCLEGFLGVGVPCFTGSSCWMTGPRLRL